MRKRVGFKNLADPPAVCADLVQHHVNAVARQVLGQFLGGVLGIETLFVGDGDDAYLFTTVRSSKGRERGVSGKMRVGRPDPKITASAYHWS